MSEFLMVHDAETLSHACRANIARRIKDNRDEGESWRLCLRVPASIQGSRRRPAARDTALLLCRGRCDGVACGTGSRSVRDRLGVWIEIFRWPHPVLADGCDGAGDLGELCADVVCPSLASLWHGL